jgi:hypothetical protein
MPMPRSAPAIPAASARVRRLQERLPELSVPALLRVRDSLEALLEQERVSVSDVNSVLRAAGD